jgi:hypothetical protein
MGSNNNFHLLVSYYKLKRAAASVLKVTAAMTPAALNTGDCIDIMGSVGHDDRERIS